MQRELFFFLDSRDSTEYFPFNTASNFTVKLPSYVMLEGSWTIGLVDIKIPTIDESAEVEYLDVFCDITNESVASERKLPILRRVKKNANDWISFNPILYFPLKMREFDRMRIYIKSDKNGTLSFDSQPMVCTFI